MSFLRSLVNSSGRYADLPLLWFTNNSSLMCPYNDSATNTFHYAQNPMR